MKQNCYVYFISQQETQIKKERTSQNREKKENSEKQRRSGGWQNKYFGLDNKGQLNKL